MLVLLLSSIQFISAHSPSHSHSGHSKPQVLVLQDLKERGKKHFLSKVNEAMKKAELAHSSRPSSLNEL